MQPLPGEAGPVPVGPVPAGPVPAGCQRQLWACRGRTGFGPIVRGEFWVLSSATAIQNDPNLCPFRSRTEELGRMLGRRPPGTQPMRGPERLAEERGPFSARVRPLLGKTALGCSSKWGPLAGWWAWPVFLLRLRRGSAGCGGPCRMWGLWKQEEVGPSSRSPVIQLLRAGGDRPGHSRAMSPPRQRAAVSQGLPPGCRRAACRLGTAVTGPRQARTSPGELLSPAPGAPAPFQPRGATSPVDGASPAGAGLLAKRAGRSRTAAEAAPAWGRSCRGMSASGPPGGAGGRIRGPAGCTL